MAAASYATTLILKINDLIVNPLIILMFAFAIVAFVWGVRAYIAGADNEEARLKGTEHIIWGIIGLFFMVAAFELVRIVIQTFGFEKDPTTMNAIEIILR